MKPPSLLLVPPALFAALAIGLAAGDGSLEAPLKIGSVGIPVTVAAGDFNKDGLLDLAAASGGPQITIQLQDPRARVIWTVLAPVRVGAGSFFVRAVDLDGDGDDDLVVADPATSAYVVLCRGDATFDRSVALPEARGSRWIAAADWNGDGKLDLASVNYDSLNYSVFWGRGDGTFVHAGNTQVSQRPHAIEAVDFDGDGQLDMVVGLQETGLLPLRARGDGQFDSKTLITNLGCVRYIATADFNADGKGDLGTSCVGTASAGISLGDGSYQRSFFIDNSRGDTALAIADLNGDRIPDFAEANTSRTSLAVYPGLGDGTFQTLPLSFQSTGDTPFFLAAADLNRDGRIDLISADSGSSSLTVFWGKAGDRFLESPDVVSGFGTGKAMAIADLDGDASPDLFISLSGQPRVQVYLKPGPSPPPLPSFAITTSSVFSSLATVDLDGDRVPDLVGASSTSGTALAALLDSTGKVRSEQALPAGTLPADVAAGRIDEDALPDLAVACSGSDIVALYWGRAGGQLEAAGALPTVAGPKRVALGDVDSDGRMDLAVLSSAAVALHFGKGDGVLGGPVVLAGDATRSYSDLALGDLDGDGRLDLVLIETKGQTATVFRGQGGRQLWAETPLPVDGAPSSVALADMDGDGLLDITTAHQNRPSVSVLLNRGPAGFGARSDYRIGFKALDHRVVDMDLDGTPDVVAFAASNLAVLRGHSRPAPAGRFRRGDVNGDGQVDLADPISSLNRLFLGGPAPPCEDAADANDDGDLNLSDPIAGLNRLFLGGAPLPPPESCGEDPTPDGLPPCASGC